MNQLADVHAEPRVWVRRSTSPLLLGLIPLLIGAELRRKGAGRSTVIRVFVGVVLVVSMGSVRVVAGPEGLVVGFGPWGWPVRRYPMARIRAARVETRTALAYAGLGYRVRPGGSRVVMGLGDSLVVELDNGRSFGVTVPDAARAARVLNATRTEARIVD